MPAASPPHPDPLRPNGAEREITLERDRVTVVEQDEVEVFEPAAAPVPASALLRWYVLLVMCLVYTISIADRYVISTVLEPIRLELHLTDSGVAFLTGVSLAFF